MLHVAFKQCDEGVALSYRTDRNLFDLRKLQAKTKVKHTVLRDFLFADDCGLAATTLQAAQQLMDKFSEAAIRFGLTVSLKKTEVMHQPAPDVTNTVPPLITVNNTALHVADKFCYLGSTVTQDLSLDTEIATRISKAASAFGMLYKRVWDERGVRLCTKIQVYNAVVLSSLLHGCQAWTLYRRHIKLLDSFHMRCLRRILRITWRDKVPDTEVLSRCKSVGVEGMLMQKQLQWCGNVIRMDDTRIPKQLLYSELTACARKPGGQKKRYKDQLHATLKACAIPHNNLETQAADRSVWRSVTHSGVQAFEKNRIGAREEKRRRRHDLVIDPLPASVFVCDVCQRPCRSQIGLYAHRRSHRRDSSTPTTQP
jgi:hypothetical protein